MNGNAVGQGVQLVPMGMGGGGGGGGFGGFGGGRPNKVDAPCRAFFQNGRCGFGENCKFSHDAKHKETFKKKDDDDEEVMVGAANKKKTKNKVKSGKIVDPHGLKDTKKECRVVHTDTGKVIKKVTTMDSDDGFEGILIPCPRHIAGQVSKTIELLRTKRAVMNGKALTKAKASKLATTTTESLVNAGITVNSDSEGNDSDDKDDTKDDFKEAMKTMAAGFQKQLAQQEQLVAAIQKGGASSSNKTRSPNGKLRKQRKSAASSTASAKSDSSSRTAELSARLFDGDSDDEEEEEEMGDDAQEVALTELLEEHIDLYDKSDRVPWTGKAAQVAWDDSAPLAGLETTCGLNITMTNTTKMPAKLLAKWFYMFEVQDIVDAKGMMLNIMQFYKKYNSPGKRLDLILRTHSIEITGAPINRKPWTQALALILAKKMKGGLIPKPPTE